MKKLTILLGILIVALFVFISPITSFVIENGLKNSDQHWAPALVFGGARMKMRILQHEDALKAFQEGIRHFPNYKQMPKIYFWVAFSYEKEDRIDMARQWYEKYLDKWPDHIWASQARNRLARLEVAAGSD
ncbi:MAG: tetratricopeptide repeat protein [Candidatus Pacebacteria bacterium]|nr:tetratricopeptide repeat protein [Candidatus Paceibacterota bacterium]